MTALPLRAPVARPDEGIALYAGITLAGVVETTHAILPGKALVGSLGICDGKEIVQLVCAERAVGLESILKAQGAAHIGLYKPDPHAGYARDTILPPPIDSLRIEEIDDATVPCPGDGDTGCQRIVEQRVVLAIIHDGTDVQSEHVNMLGIDGVDHGLWILERGAELESAASVAKCGIEEPPGGVEPQ